MKYSKNLYHKNESEQFIALLVSTDECSMRVTDENHNTENKLYFQNVKEIDNLIEMLEDIRVQLHKNE